MMLGAHDADASSGCVSVCLSAAAAAAAPLRLREIVSDLQRRIVSGEVPYVHCWGGPGRVGLVGACFLGKRVEGPGPLLLTWLASQLSEPTGTPTPPFILGATVV
jgi:hypothetical protein